MDRFGRSCGQPSGNCRWESNQGAKNRPRIDIRAWVAITWEGWSGIGAVRNIPVVVRLQSTSNISGGHKRRTLPLGHDRVLFGRWPLTRE